MNLSYFEVAYLDVKFVLSYLLYCEFFLGGQSVVYVTNIKMDSCMLLPADFVDVNLIS